MNTMNTLKKYINKAVEYFSIFLVAVMVLLVTWQIIARYLLRQPSSFSEALTTYMFVWLVVVTATYAFGSRDHMCISFLNDKLKGMVHTVVNILIELLTIVFAGLVMTYGGIVIAQMNFIQLDSSLHIPTGVIYSIIPICGVVIIFYCICNILDEIQAAKQPVLTGKEGN